MKTKTKSPMRDEQAVAPDEAFPVALRTPSNASSGARPDPEVVAVAQRRQFSSANKLRILDAPKQVEGTGIGLSSSKSLIERMDGQIGVVSQSGQACEFWFALPAVADVSAAVGAQ